MQHSLNKTALTLLVAISEATRSEDGFLYVNPKQSASLVTGEYVQVNDQMADGDKLATRATELGLQLVDSLNAGSEGSEGSEGSQGLTTGTDGEANKPKQTRIAPAKAIVASGKIPMPDAPKGGRKGSVYPFDELDVEGSFFVAASAERPNPAKTLASTVTSANERYAEEIDGEFRVNRMGDKVPATRQIRKFVVMPVEDGAPWGEEYAGVKGAGVWRTL